MCIRCREKTQVDSIFFYTFLTRTPLQFSLSTFRKWVPPPFSIFTLQSISLAKNKIILTTSTCWCHYNYYPRRSFQPRYLNDPGTVALAPTTTKTTTMRFLHLISFILILPIQNNRLMNGILNGSIVMR